jgi:hypothetical protein
LGGRAAVQRWSVLVCAAFLNLAVASPFVAVAQAQDGRRVAIFMRADSVKVEQDATVVQSIFRQSVSRLLGVELSPGSPVRNADNAARAAAAAAEGEEALNLDPAVAPDFGARAAEKFQLAADLLQAAPGAGDVRLLAWVMKGLGVARVIQGDRANAESLYRRSVLLYSDQTAAEYLYTDEASDLYEQVTQTMGTESSGQLEIISRPAGAEVYVGGQLRGYAPLSLGNLSAGEHYVMLAKDGYWRWAEFVGVVPGESTARTVDLAEAPAKAAIDVATGAVSRKMSRKAGDTATTTLSEALGASDVLLARVDVNKAGEFEIDGFYRDGLGQVSEVDFQMARDASFIGNIQAFLEQRLGVTGAPELPQGPLSAPQRIAPASAEGSGDYVIDPNSPLFKKTGEEEESITDQWWFWTLIGVGAVGAGLAIALPLTLGKDEGGGGPTGNLLINLNGLP